MNKETKKQVEAKLITAIEETLSLHNRNAIGKIKKLVKDSGKKITKKFFKAIKAAEKKAAKRKVTAQAKPVKAASPAKKSARKKKPASH